MFPGYGDLSDFEQLPGRYTNYFVGKFPEVIYAIGRDFEFAVKYNCKTQAIPFDGPNSTPVRFAPELMRRKVLFLAAGDVFTGRQYPDWCYNEPSRMC